MDRILALRAFVRLVEKGSFTAVANELRVKQSTVSKWLAHLEEEVGAPLVDRTTRARRVTESGQRFYELSLNVLEAYEAAIAEASESRDSLQGLIRISLPVVFGRLFVMPEILSFMQAHPRVEVEMIFADHYVSLVEEGYDLAVRAGVQIDSSLRSHALGESCRRLVAAPSYLHRAGTPKHPDELLQHQCLRHAALGASNVWCFTANDETYRVAARGRVHANNSEATRTLAREGLGIALLAAWLVDDDVQKGRLVPLLNDYTPPRAPIRALTPPGRRVTPRVRLLIHHLRERLIPKLAIE